MKQLHLKVWLIPADHLRRRCLCSSGSRKANECEAQGEKSVGRKKNAKKWVFHGHEWEFSERCLCRMHLLSGIILAQDGLGVGEVAKGLVAKVEKTIRVRLYRNFPETLIRKVEGGGGLALRLSFTHLFNKTPVEEEWGGEKKQTRLFFSP